MGFLCDKRQVSYLRNKKKKTMTGLLIDKFVALPVLINIFKLCQYTKLSNGYYHVLNEMKVNGEKIAMLTAYDYSIARILDEAEIDVILVGDSGIKVMAGFETTLL